MLPAFGVGKFANGAITGAFIYAFNQTAQPQARPKNPYERLDSNGNTTAKSSLRSGVVLNDRGFIDQLLDLSELSDGAVIDVISGYRSQAHQNSLTASGNTRAVTRSQHTVGLAADIMISGLSARQGAIAAFRSGLFNGVNLYTQAVSGVNSIHVDQMPNRSGYLSIDWRRQPAP